MDTSEFFSDNTPKLSPEEQVRENQRLGEIDKQQQVKAKRALAEAREDTEEGRRLKSELIFELTGIAEDGAAELASEVDPDYTYAQNIPITELVSKPSRLLFLKRQVQVAEKRDIAVWHIPVNLDGVSLSYLGRNGVLYAMHSKEEQYAVKMINLESLPLSDIEALVAGIPSLIKMYRQFQSI